jgi:hypothetical protein
MYRALWRSLPRPTPVRILILAVMAGVLLIALHEWVFPWVASTFVDTQATVGAPQ